MFGVVGDEVEYGEWIESVVFFVCVLFVVGCGMIVGVDCVVVEVFCFLCYCVYCGVSGELCFGVDYYWIV